MCGEHLEHVGVVKRPGQGQAVLCGPAAQGFKKPYIWSRTGYAPAATATLCPTCANQYRLATSNHAAPLVKKGGDHPTTSLQDIPITTPRPGLPQQFVKRVILPGQNTAPTPPRVTAIQITFNGSLPPTVLSPHHSLGIIDLPLRHDGRAHVEKRPIPFGALFCPSSLATGLCEDLIKKRSVDTLQGNVAELCTALNYTMVEYYTVQHSFYYGESQECTISSFTVPDNQAMDRSCPGNSGNPQVGFPANIHNRFQMYSIRRDLGIYKRVLGDQLRSQTSLLQKTTGSYKNISSGYPSHSFRQQEHPKRIQFQSQSFMVKSCGQQTWMQLCQPLESCASLTLSPRDLMPPWEDKPVPAKHIYLVSFKKKVAGKLHFSREDKQYKHRLGGRDGNATWTTKRETKSGNNRGLVEEACSNSTGPYDVCPYNNRLWYNGPFGRSRVAIYLLYNTGLEIGPHLTAPNRSSLSLFISIRPDSTQTTYPGLRQSRQEFSEFVDIKYSPTLWLQVTYLLVQLIKSDAFAVSPIDLANGILSHVRLKRPKKFGDKEA
ncbi:hypothetical protein J6590_044209 [Homalodisca vitripennis]|nr:hypothetical protein J6590_044209 [Homalodisca vitripennis]